MSRATMNDLPALQHILIEAFVWHSMGHDHRKGALGLAMYARGYVLGGRPIMEMLYAYSQRCPWAVEPGEPQRIVQYAIDHIGTRSIRAPLDLVHVAHGS